MGFSVKYGDIMRKCTSRKLFMGIILQELCAAVQHIVNNL